MKSKTIIFLILIVIVAFSYGLLVGHYEIFPFEMLSEIKKFQQVCPKEMLDKLLNPLTLKPKTLKAV